MAYMQANAPPSVGVKTPNRMPPSSSTGIMKAGMASRMIFEASPFLNSIFSLYPSMRTMKNHVTIRQMPMIRPGTRPIMNSLVMDRPTVAPSRIKFVLGGMMGPRMAPDAMTPPARPGL